MMETRCITYNSNHREIIKKGIDSLKDALYNSTDEEVTSLLFCLDYYLDPYYGCTLPFEKEIYELLQNFLFHCENQDLRMDVLELFIYARYPLTILEKNLNQLTGEPLLQARYLLYDEDEEEFHIAGYYICKINDCPEYLNKISDKMISVSDCLCTHEPVLEYLAGWKPNGDSVDYQKKCNLSRIEYESMSRDALQLLEDGVLMPDGRFINKSDAFAFYNKYFASEENLLVSLSFHNNEVAKLDSSFSCAVELNKTNYINQNTQFLGYDIIGWDICSFHSFLCNSLHKEVNQIKFSSMGLLDMKYSDVESLAQQLQGKGEPVEWIVGRLDAVKGTKE